MQKPFMIHKKWIKKVFLFLASFSVLLGVSITLYAAHTEAPLDDVGTYATLSQHVDPRMGQLNETFSVGHLLGGPLKHTYALSIHYRANLSPKDPYYIGRGWAYSLPYLQGDVLHWHGGTFTLKSAIYHVYEHGYPVTEPAPKFSFEGVTYSRNLYVKNGMLHKLLFVAGAPDQFKNTQKPTYLFSQGTHATPQGQFITNPSFDTMTIYTPSGVVYHFGQQKGSGPYAQTDLAPQNQKGTNTLYLLSIHYPDGHELFFHYRFLTQVISGVVPGKSVLSYKSFMKGHPAPYKGFSGNAMRLISISNNLGGQITAQLTQKKSWLSYGTETYVWKSHLTASNTASVTMKLRPVNLPAITAGIVKPNGQILHPTLGYAMQGYLPKTLQNASGRVTRFTYSTDIPPVSMDESPSDFEQHGGLMLTEVQYPNNTRDVFSYGHIKDWSAGVVYEVCHFFDLNNNHYSQHNYYYGQYIKPTACSHLLSVRAMPGVSGLREGYNSQINFSGPSFFRILPHGADAQFLGWGTDMHQVPAVMTSGKGYNVTWPLGDLGHNYWVAQQTRNSLYPNAIPTAVNFYNQRNHLINSITVKPYLKQIDTAAMRYSITQKALNYYAPKGLGIIVPPTTSYLGKVSLSRANNLTQITYAFIQNLRANGASKLNSTGPMQNKISMVKSQHFNVKLSAVDHTLTPQGIMTSGNTPSLVGNEHFFLYSDARLSMLMSKPLYIKNPYIQTTLIHYGEVNTTYIPNTPFMPTLVVHILSQGLQTVYTQYIINTISNETGLYAFAMTSGSPYIGPGPKLKDFYALTHRQFLYKPGTKFGSDANIPGIYLQLPPHSHMMTVGNIKGYPMGNITYDWGARIRNTLTSGLTGSQYLFPLLHKKIVGLSSGSPLQERYGDVLTNTNQQHAMPIVGKRKIFYHYGIGPLQRTMRIWTTRRALLSSSGATSTISPQKVTVRSLDSGLPVQLNSSISMTNGVAKAATTLQYNNQGELTQQQTKLTPYNQAPEVTSDIGYQKTILGGSDATAQVIRTMTNNMTGQQSKLDRQFEIGGGYQSSTYNNRFQPGALPSGAVPTSLMWPSSSLKTAAQIKYNTIGQVTSRTLFNAKLTTSKGKVVSVGQSQPVSTESYLYNQLGQVKRVINDTTEISPLTFTSRILSSSGGDKVFYATHFLVKQGVVLASQPFHIEKYVSHNGIIQQKINYVSTFDQVLSDCSSPYYPSVLVPNNITTQCLQKVIKKGDYSPNMTTTSTYNFLGEKVASYSPSMLQANRYIYNQFGQLLQTVGQPSGPNMKDEGHFYYRYNGLGQLTCKAMSLGTAGAINACYTSAKKMPANSQLLGIRHYNNWGMLLSQYNAQGQMIKSNVYDQYGVLSKVLGQTNQVLTQRWYKPCTSANQQPTYCLKVSNSIQMTSGYLGILKQFQTAHENDSNVTKYSGQVGHLVSFYYPNGALKARAYSTGIGDQLRQISYQYYAGGALKGRSTIVYNSGGAQEGQYGRAYVYLGTQGHVLSTITNTFNQQAGDFAFQTLYGYTPSYQVQSITHFGGRNEDVSSSVVFHRNSLMQLASIDRSKGYNTYFHYDPYGRLKNWFLGESDSLSKSVLGHQFTYNAQGKIYQKTTYFGGQEKKYDQYTYDGKGQLKTFEVVNSQNPTQIGALVLYPRDSYDNPVRLQTFKYGVNNNISQVETQIFGLSGFKNYQVSYQYNMSSGYPNQLLSISGNDAAPAPFKNRFTQSYIYYPNQQLYQDAGGGKFYYNAANRLAMHQSFYNGQDNRTLVKSYYGYASNGLLNWQKSIIHGYDGKKLKTPMNTIPAARYGLSDVQGAQMVSDIGNTRYYTNKLSGAVKTIRSYHDYQGSTVLMSMSSGKGPETQQFYYYMPFGVQSQASGVISTVPKSHVNQYGLQMLNLADEALAGGYIGEAKDPTTGYTMLGRNRYYHAQLVRYITADNFTTFNKVNNLYAYSLNDPISNVDWSGHDAWGVLKGFVEGFDNTIVNAFVEPLSGFSTSVNLFANGGPSFHTQAPWDTVEQMAEQPAGLVPIAGPFLQNQVIDGNWSSQSIGNSMGSSLAQGAMMAGGAAAGSVAGDTGSVASSIEDEGEEMAEIAAPNDGVSSAVIFGPQDFMDAPYEGPGKFAMGMRSRFGGDILPDARNTTTGLIFRSLVDKEGLTNADVMNQLASHNALRIKLRGGDDFSRDANKEVETTQRNPQEARRSVVNSADAGDVELDENAEAVRINKLENLQKKLSAMQKSGDEARLFNQIEVAKADYQNLRPAGDADGWDDDYQNESQRLDKAVNIAIGRLNSYRATMEGLKRQINDLSNNRAPKPILKGG